MQYRVFVIYEDFTQKDVSDQVLIQSLNPDIAIADSENILHGGHEGTAELTTTYDGIKSEREFIHVVPQPISYTIEVFPQSVTVPLNAEGNFKAMKHNSDGTQEDITSSVIWTSNNTNVDINTFGHAKAKVIGSSIITATDGTVSSNANINIENKSVKNVQITPNNITIDINETVQFEVTVVYDDHTLEEITPFATLESLAPSFADFITHDTIIGKKAGAAELKATWFGFISEREFIHISE